MRTCILFDKVNGEEVELDADMVNRITGVEISNIDWLVEKDGMFDIGRWKVCLSPIFGDPIGRDEIFAKWNRTGKR